ncbi:helix-turn-helix transcriptional regulator, partial [Oenococcus oeni]
MSLGESLKSARNAVGLTQDQVAKKMYVTRQTVSRWEQGKTLPNIYVLRELKQLYGLSLDNLSLQTKRNEEFRKMKKINWLALFGA